MQVNVLLKSNSCEQADFIRKHWYPTTTARQTRDAFIFNECIDRYKGEPEDLVTYLERCEGNETVQRKVTIKRESFERLKAIAAAINKPTTTTYRAIIAYTIDNLSNTEYDEQVAEPVGISQILLEKIAQLEQQMKTCNQTLKEIKELTRK